MAKSRANILVGAIVIVVLAAAIGAFAYMQIGAQAAGGAASDGAPLRAIVHDGEGGVFELPLDQDAELPVSTGLGANTIVVEGGAVFVSEADCDNQDCVHQGKIDAPGRQIICLPHKLWIEVVADGQQSGAMDTDAVAGDGAQGASDAPEKENLDAVAR